MYKVSVFFCIVTFGINTNSLNVINGNYFVFNNKF